ncbi:VHS domain protein [Aspergillus eucalypticola CBS 122712]|uniref:VHS domain protein n=1 Tax=Aspergillus eucalypticola (strain CBS 122712 / IBT 29274) TaxID=1448314 RepID=A0A317UPV8_ASPEC|nr:VHS domain protein [Aspergillus eucalypticola CBS 122712]PWY63256.1 VHS domain protein [Aspergillus eucalypticola CBS 122712]
MAARDRFGAYAEPGLTPLQRAVRNACDLSHYEPNLALNLEVADLINSKKGNAPREAAIEIVHLINSRNQNVALLALAISTKEFLNELVRRFPERPQLRPTRVQHRILESIEEWRQTICQTSRYKEDLGHIRDMHRLLLYKGYVFPEIRHEDAAVLNPSDNLRSAEEMEEEEKEAQSAKLQELIRRGTPADLQEANRLMKVMAGYDNRHKTDYRAKAAEEVAKVQQKAKILEEMLQSHQPGDPVAEGDVFEELAGALQSAHPKIQKMCEEESDDPEAVHKLLEINDSIHRTIERYKLVKKGDWEAATRIPKGTLGTTTGVSKNANNQLSLIDFDPEPPASASTNGNGAPAATGGSSLENDLLGLSIDEPAPALGGISLGPSITTTATPPVPQAPGGFKPNYDILSSLGSSQPPSQSATPVPSARPQSIVATPTPPPAVDPFASLVSASPRHASPLPSGGSAAGHAAAGGSLLDLAGSGPTQPVGSSGKAAEEDEWNFASSLPESNTLPSTNRVSVLNSALRIEFVARRHPQQSQQIHVVALFSNGTSQPLNELHFQLCKVPSASLWTAHGNQRTEEEEAKQFPQAYTLQLRPQSGRDIGPLQNNGVQQEMLISGVAGGKGNSIKMRYRVSYRVGSEHKEEQGMVPSLGIA